MVLFVLVIRCSNIRYEMIIDCHTHLGRNEHINVGVKQLLKSMDAAKIDKALVFAGELNDCPNEWMIEQIKPHRDRLYGVMAYHHPNLYWSDFKKMAEDNGIVGIKFYTGYEHFYPADLYSEDKHTNALSLHYNPLQLCSELGIPAIFHCGDCLNSVKAAKLKYAHPLNIDEVAVDYDDVTFVIAHIGYPWVRDTAEVCYKNKNVFTDISGFVYGEFDGQDKNRFKKVLDEFLDIAGSDKLLFGTDFPISNQRSYIEALEWLSVNTINKKMSETFTPQYMTQNVKRTFKLK
jgi:predicted TIM-barrel fold metal-dependent hydrolase